jgi:hypothetical protein
VEFHPEALGHAGWVGTSVVVPLLALEIAVADWIVLVTLAIVIPLYPGPPPGGATNLCRVTTVLRFREHVPS